MAYRSSGSRVNEFEEHDAYYSNPPRAQTQVRERERGREYEGDRESRVPTFLREDARRTETGPLVLRQRDVETMERQRRRSPDPVRVRETRTMERARSVSPPPRREFVERDEVRVRAVERERVRSPSRGPSVERFRTRIVERERSRERSPSPLPIPVERRRPRFVERERSPSIERESEHIRIIRRERQRSPSPSPSPSPVRAPPVIRGPTVEREVITHYRDIDHGVVAIRAPSPAPPPRVRTTERNSEIDIYTSRNATEVDIHKHTRSHSRGRSPSRSRERVSHRRPPPARAVYDDEVIVHSDRNHLHVDIEERHRSGRPRAHSAVPPPRPAAADRWDEGEYITSRIDARGRVGEAWHGATKDWEIVDVPPGTERVLMDGAGGGGAEVTWQKYNGVRRSRFIPEREEGRASSSTVSDGREERDRDRDRGRERESRLSVQIYDSGRDREREVDVEKVTDRRIGCGRGPAHPRRSEMWTEITKDLVVREALDQMGYEYEETEYFFYIMQYLRYEDVLQIVQLSDSIRRARKDRLREIQWQHDLVREDEWEHHHHHHRHGHRHSRHGHSHSGSRYVDDRERVVEREVVYDSGPQVRGYLR